MEQRKVMAHMGLIMSKAALIKPALRGFFWFVWCLFRSRYMRFVEYVPSLSACPSAREQAPSFIRAVLLENGA